MSNFSGHLTASAVVSSIVLIGTYTVGDHLNLTMQDAVFPAFMAFFFALFPDIDIKSVPSKILYVLIGIALIICIINKKYYYGNIIGLLAIIPQIVTHRGFFHSIFAMFLFPLVSLYFLYIGVFDIKITIFTYIASVIGYFSHLLLDNI